MILHRSPQNPIITRSDVLDFPPDIVDATAVFNPGAVKYGDEFLLILRVQTRSRETYLLMAESRDGIKFRVRDEGPIHFQGIEEISETVYHIYDPRITEIEERFYLMFAADTDTGCRLGTAATDDFREFEFLGLGAEPDVRNGVLFSDRIDGRFLRLDRPNTTALSRGPTSGDEIFLSESEDLVHWTRIGSVFRGRPHYWDERIGSGPPPIKTKEGWLHIYHGVATHFESANIYQAGVVLLDLNRPSHVLGRSRGNILEPRELYELIGQVPNVVFPTGMIVEAVDVEGFAQPTSAVSVYYGAADTCIGLARTTVADLIQACGDS